MRSSLARGRVIRRGPGRGASRWPLLVLKPVLFALSAHLPRPALDDLRQEPRRAAAQPPSFVFDTAHCILREVEAAPGEDPALIDGASLGSAPDRPAPDQPMRPAHPLRHGRPGASGDLTARQSRSVMLDAKPPPEGMLLAAHLRARRILRTAVSPHVDGPRTAYRSAGEENRPGSAEPPEHYPRPEALHGCPLRLETPAPSRALWRCVLETQLV